MTDVGRVGEPTGLGSADEHSGQTSCPDPSGAIPRAVDPDPWLWYWGYGGEPEVYHGGEETREAIIEVARLEGDGEAFTIIEAKRGGFKFDIFDADRVLEDFDDQNEECWGEDGPDFRCPQGSKRELEKLLASAFEAWFDEYKPTRRFAFEQMRNEEFFEESPALAAAARQSEDPTQIGAEAEGPQSGGEAVTPNPRIHRQGSSHDA